MQGLEYFNFIQTPNPWGEYGSMDYLGEPSSLTPKYNALVDFINSPSLAAGGVPGIDTAGTAANFTVTALGPNGSGINTGYTGTVHFTSSDPAAVLPADYTFTAADAGMHTFIVALKTAGIQSITVTDPANGLTRSESGITVQAAAAQSLRVTGFPTTATAGAANNVTVTAYDAYGNMATGYVGTVHFTSSDPKAVLPANYTFTAADAGAHTFSVTLSTPGTQSITVTDTATASITGSASLTVTTAQPPTLDPIADQTMSAGGSLTIALGGHDPDGDPLTYSANAVNQLYDLKTRDGIYFTGNSFYNWGGLQEKWLAGSGSSWYFLLPNGSLILWDGSSQATGTLVAQLGTAVYNDPSLLYNATNTPVPVTLTVSGNQLTIAPNSGVHRHLRRSRHSQRWAPHGHPVVQRGRGQQHGQPAADPGPDRQPDDRGRRQPDDRAQRP